MSEAAETFAPRESHDFIQVGNRKLPVTLREMTIRKGNQFEAALTSVVTRTLEACQELSPELAPSEAQDRILEAQEKARADVLPRILIFEPNADLPTPAEYEEVVPSVKLRLIAKQQELNRRSEIVGELNGLLTRVAQQAGISSTTQALESSASASTGSSGLPGSVINSEPPTI